ncbi:MAG TPA: gluconokinase [Bryobacteraceae bacterium]|nr:gluconokinase [Bryobacteraceae bacterium]
MSTQSSNSYIVSLDIGSSSVRALLFDASARQVEGFGARLPSRLETTPDGGVEIDPEALADLVVDCLDELHRQVQADGLKIAAVAASAFWHSFLGTDAAGKPTLPILHLLDTRSASEVARVPNAHARTGCVPHSSYWPAKLLWLAKFRPAEFAATRHWISFPEYLFQKLFGKACASTSMVSGSGVWNQLANDYDDETLRAIRVDRATLANPADLDRPASGLLLEFGKLWPAFDNIPWYPALGDGACDSIGSGAIGQGRFALMVGTTGALRAVMEGACREIPAGLWCYRVDRKRFVMGGALSDGGDVYAWMKRTLALPRDTEARLESATPGTHGLTFLPFFSGERSPDWRSDARAAITGISLATDPFDIFRAGLESVALQFREIYQQLAASLGVPTEILASGGALLHSPTWTQMMADALARPVTACTEPEASSRGAALWGLEQIGGIGSITALPASTGATFDPRIDHEQIYDRLLSERRELFRKLYGGC